MRTYRNPRWALVTQTVLMTLMALIFVSIAIQPGPAGHPGTAPGYLAIPDGFDILNPNGSTPTHPQTG